MKYRSGKSIIAAAVGSAVALLAGCSAPLPPQAVAPPPRVVIPPRPYPPMGAAPNLMIPVKGIDGIRRTVNTGLGSAQTVWNLRSAYNVAALSCQDVKYIPVLEGYKAFLKTHAKKLALVNKDLDAQFKADHGKTYIRVRETYNTQVYNYFAQPPTLHAFCDASLALSTQIAPVASKDLELFASTGLPQLETVFQEFYNSYDQYRVDLAAWEARYGGGPPVQAFGPVSQPIDAAAPPVRPASEGPAVAEPTGVVVQQVPGG